MSPETETALERAADQARLEQAVEAPLRDPAWLRALVEARRPGGRGPSVL